MSAIGGSRRLVEPPAIESGFASVGCEPISLLTAGAVLGLVTLGSVGSVDVIRRARSAVGAERERLLDEYEAFLAFAERVAGVPVAARPDGGRTAGNSLASGARTDGGLQSVREAYQETVMDVPHFETDYDESLAEHLAAEFSPEIAAAIVDGSRYTPTVRRPLLTSAKTAARNRRVLAEELGAEVADLEDAEERLRGVSERFEVTAGSGLGDRRFPDLQARWERLGELQTECESLLERRQSQLHERTSPAVTHCRSPTTVSAYLYGELDVDFPVLATTTELLERIEAERDHTIEALTRRRS